MASRTMNEIETGIRCRDKEQRKALRKKSFEQREIRIPQRTGQTLLTLTPPTAWRTEVVYCGKAALDRLLFHGL